MTVVFESMLIDWVIQVLCRADARCPAILLLHELTNKRCTREDYPEPLESGITLPCDQDCETVELGHPAREARRRSPRVDVFRILTP